MLCCRQVWNLERHSEIRRLIELAGAWRRGFSLVMLLFTRRGSCTCVCGVGVETPPPQSKHRRLDWLTMVGGVDTRGFKHGGFDIGAL